MRRRRWWWLLAVLAVLGAAAVVFFTLWGRPTVVYPASEATGTAQRFDFEDVPPGGLPAGAEVYGGSWQVRAEPDAPSGEHALCQSGTADYPALSLGPQVYRDVAVSARVKAISGSTDQAAGLLVRVQNAGNYLIGRANALEGNVNLYRYSGSVRRTLADGTAPVRQGTWHELRMEVRGERLQTFLDGRLVSRATDATFPAGRVGLWTKADSQTCFDDVTVEPLR
ncbi:family 16 glycoside hydrolase [Nonomuraea sp. NPDC049400]|uniref:family 16 glycoside hydrolase n=1 Tax=Nonomuraea sp. NPDC049400 TaxID=3364352 RepID=UPI0037B16457